MAKSDFMPNADGGKATLFVLFRDNIGPQLAALGIPAADPDIAQQAADATRFRAIVDFCGNMQNAAQGWTAEKNYERDGGNTAPAGQTVPVLPPGFPPAVPPGIVARFRALVPQMVTPCRWARPSASKAPRRPAPIWPSSKGRSRIHSAVTSGGNLGRFRATSSIT
jgi:hypothetical protein